MPKMWPQTTRKRKSKPGPDSIWEKMVLKRLRTVDRPLTYEELTDEIMEFAKFPKENRKKVKQSVINVTFRLRKRDKKIDTFSAGSREKFLALSSWFESPGVIKQAYKNRVTDLSKKNAPGKKKAAMKNPVAKKKNSSKVKKSKVSTSKKRKTAKV